MVSADVRHASEGIDAKREHIKPRLSMIQDRASEASLRQNSLRQRVISASLWSAIDVVLSNVIRLASNLILARILLPDAFGAMAIVSTLQTGLALLTDISIHRSIVQSKSGEDFKFLRVAWSVQVVRGAALAVVTIVIAIIVWICGPYLTATKAAYGDPLLPSMLCISAVMPILAGLESTNKLLAVRKMQIGRVIGLNLSAQMSSVVAMMLIVCVSPTVWALLGGAAIGGLVRTFLTHRIFYGPAMRPEWDPEIAHELWQLGRPLGLSSAFTFVSMNLDRIIIAGVLSSAGFGYYSVAAMWAQVPAMLLNKLADPIGHSAFSEAGRSSEFRAMAMYRKFRTANDIARAVMCALLVIAGPTVISILYPHHYETAVPFVTILSLGILSGRFEMLKLFVLSRGDADAIMRSSLVQFVVVLTFVPLGLAVGGVAGALVVSTLAPLATLPILTGRAQRASGNGRLTEWVMATLILVAGAVAYVASAGAINTTS